MAQAFAPQERPPVVTPSLPGPADASVEDLLTLLDKLAARFCGEAGDA